MKLLYYFKTLFCRIKIYLVYVIRIFNLHNAFLPCNKYVDVILEILDTSLPITCILDIRCLATNDPESTIVRSVRGDSIVE